MDMHYPYQLPPLPYAYEALSPNISGDTLHFHHDKHFQTYVDNLNTALGIQPSALLRRHVRLSQLPPLRRAGHGHGAGLRLF